MDKTKTNEILRGHINCTSPWQFVDLQSIDQKMKAVFLVLTFFAIANVKS